MSEQPSLRLLPAPRQDTLALLMQTFGNLLVPLEEVRCHYFRNLNEKGLSEAIAAGRINLPVTTLDSSRKAIKFVDIRHLAAYIDSRSYIADESSHHKIEAGTTRQTTA